MAMIKDWRVWGFIVIWFALGTVLSIWAELRQSPSETHAIVFRTGSGRALILIFAGILFLAGTVVFYKDFLADVIFKPSLSFWQRSAAVTGGLIYLAGCIACLYSCPGSKVGIV